MGLRSWLRERRDDGELTEAATKALTPKDIPERTGWAYGVPRGGLNDVNAGVGEATQTDRRSQLEQLYESYLACPWAWGCVNAIARTITAGGMVMDWNSDTGEGEKPPDKPENVLAVERLIQFTNPRQNIRQLMRNVIVDLLVFGDAYIEVTWWGDTPVALYNLDNPTTTPLADEHGAVTGYVQVTDTGLRAEFEPRDVIHISLDAPRSGVFGVSPTQAALLPITAWLFAAATAKEMFRKGLPATVHADFPAGASKGEQNTWVAQVMAQNIGPRNIGRPWVTKGGAKLTELQTGKVADALAFLNQKRDEILGCYGVPPSKATVIESGNLGGGTGEEQDKSYKIDVCAPIGELVLEAFNFSVVTNGFGVEDWHAKFREVDYRASQVIETIRDTRLRNGSWILNKYRAEIGEPPVEGGDKAVLVDRQNLVLWSDMEAMSKAMVASKSAPAFAAGEQMQGNAPVDQQQPGQEPPEDGKPAEAVSPVMLDRFRRRLREAHLAMGLTETSGAGNAVYAQLAKDFPAAAIGWVKADAEWSGVRQVKLSQIDTSDRDKWDATRDPAKVDKLRRKIRVKGKPKPLVLIRWPGAARWVIADGHHRFLAAEAEDLDAVPAFTGRVSREHGPWEVMAASETGRDKASRGKAA